MKNTLVVSLRYLSAQVEQTLCECEQEGTSWCDWCVDFMATAGKALRHKNQDGLALRLRNDANICLIRAQKAHKHEKTKTEDTHDHDNN
jgi:hypothetical protein